jgi:HD-GYP domain-containing protein (c-di-GMP phosphodiesterase class II)
MLADVWDALRSTRPYRAAWPRDRVRAHIEGGIGTHFDPEVARVFLDLEASGSFDAVARAYAVDAAPAD